MRIMLLIYMVLSLACHYYAFFVNGFTLPSVANRNIVGIVAYLVSSHCIIVWMLFPRFSPIFEMSTFAHFPIFASIKLKIDQTVGVGLLESEFD